VLIALLLTPVLAGVAALVLRAERARRGLLVLAAAAHSALCGAAWAVDPEPIWGGWLALDAQGLIFLTLVSALFFAASVYAVGYLGREGHGERKDIEEELFFSNAPEAVFIACLLFFLATMTLTTLCQHLGLFWVAVEATTLASAPLIYFHRHHRSLEATWKYLLICSVGIALALLGNLFLSVAASRPGEGGISMTLGDLVGEGPRLETPWLRAAFILLLVGYGTKMGLAPLHTWLPDAHSESPSVVSALLSGALLNCAFLGILRAQQVLGAAGEGAFGRGLLVGFGLLSMAVATVFILGQSDYKRMLAYSSVEHMGILAVGVGVGGAGAFGAMLHAVNHSLAKGMLFLVAGNLLAAYQTKSTAEVRGVLGRLPATGVLWLAGLLAITGSPPFGPFLSELTIFLEAVRQGQTAVATLFLALLALVFVGMATIGLRMAQGAPPEGASAASAREPAWAVLPPAALAALVLTLGLWIPEPLGGVLRDAARALGGS
jgi:hydrogenase-4 component F